MYYLALVQNDNTPALFAYETLDAALARYHSELAYRSSERKSTKCTILDNDLQSLRNDSYIAPPEAEEG